MAPFELGDGSAIGVGVPAGVGVAMLAGVGVGVAPSSKLQPKGVTTAGAKRLKQIKRNKLWHSLMFLCSCIV